MDRSVVAVTIVVSYDIANDARRSRLAALLQAWGDRVQLSVFVLSVSPPDLEELLERADGLIDPNTDSLHVFRQCQGCWGEQVALGQASVEPPPVFWSVT